jgi:hypothetical protein
MPGSGRYSRASAVALFAAAMQRPRTSRAHCRQVRRLSGIALSSVSENRYCRKSGFSAHCARTCRITSGSVSPMPASHAQIADCEALSAAPSDATNLSATLVNASYSAINSKDIPLQVPPKPTRNRTGSVRTGSARHSRDILPYPG